MLHEYEIFTAGFVCGGVGMALLMVGLLCVFVKYIEYPVKPVSVVYKKNRVNRMIVF